MLQEQPVDRLVEVDMPGVVEARPTKPHKTGLLDMATMVAQAAHTHLLDQVEVLVRLVQLVAQAVSA